MSRSRSAGTYEFVSSPSTSHWRRGAPTRFRHSMVQEDPLPSYLNKARARVHVPLPTPPAPDTFASTLASFQVPLDTNPAIPQTTLIDPANVQPAYCSVDSTSLDAQVCRHRWQRLGVTPPP